MPTVKAISDVPNDEIQIQLSRLNNDVTDAQLPKSNLREIKFHDTPEIRGGAVHAKSNPNDYSHVWFNDENPEQSSDPTKREINKHVKVFNEMQTNYRGDGTRIYPSTAASNLFTLDPNVGIAVSLGRKDDPRYDSARNKQHPSRLRAASLGEFQDCNLPARRGSLQLADIEQPSKPKRSMDVEFSKEQPIVKTSCQRLDTETNEPHPSLEYPPLYFIIKTWPWLLEAIKSLYLFRWRVSYPLQRRVPASQYFRKVGVHFTWGELLLILPFFALVVIGTLWSFLFPSPSITGQVSRLPLIFCFATALHNSFLSLLLGMPFERALWYHKLAGRIAFINGIFHTYVCYFYPDDDHSIQDQPSGKYANIMFAPYLVYDTENISGTAILSLVTAILITSVPYIRHKLFEVFYYLHVVFAATMAACAFYHSGMLVPLLVASTWGIDLVIRKLIMAATRYPRKAQTRIISPSVVELRFPKIRGFDFNPGQYVYLCVPEISLLEWHPFSISSSPGQKTVTLHIRKAGNWTAALHELAQTKEEIAVLMEGPFGSVGVDITSSRYKFVLLISGGIGITPMQSICNQLIYEHGTGKRELKKMTFLWMERDPIVMSDVQVVRRSSSVHFDTVLDDSSVISDLEEGLSRKNDDLPMSIASTFLAHVPPSRVTDSDLDNQYDIQFDSADFSKDSRTATRRPSSGFLAAVADMPPAFARRLSMGRNSDHKPLATCPKNNQNEIPSATFGGQKTTSGEADDARELLGRRNSSRSLGGNTGNNSMSSFGRSSNHRPAFGREASMMSLGLLSEKPVYGDDLRHDSNEFGEDDTFLDAAYTQTMEVLPTDVLDMQVFLTSKDPNSCFGNLPFVHEGRPDIKNKFLQIREEAIAAGERRVAVCVCAPAAIVSICQKASIKFSNHQVQFDFHSEIFG